MVRDAEGTRRRLLDAALEEFAARGIAGARVDRIAAAAKSNKAQIYHYFGSKHGLFDAVFDRIVTATLDDTPIDPTDLPGYAGRLFDRYLRHPEVQRLATWHRLEHSGGDDPIIAIAVSNSAKIEALGAAQRDGILTDRFEPAVLLALVLQLSSTWSSLTPEYAVQLADLGVAAQRRAVVESVAALLA